MGRQGYRTFERNTPQETTMTKVEYLTEIIRDTVNIYARSFERTERPKIQAILRYYGLELENDMSYDLKWDTFWEGNKTLTMTWWVFEPYGSIETSICY